MKKIILLITFFLFGFPSIFYANTPTVTAKFETDPVPMGKTSTDDPAIWVNFINPSDSLIFGTNKNKKKKGGMGGLGIYNLQGKEMAYYQVGRLNNVDIKQNIPHPFLLNKTLDMAVASNREHNSLTLFNINRLNGEITTIHNLKLYDQGISLEPYGFCLYQRPLSENLYAIIPQKTGKVHRYEIIFNGQQPVLIPRPIIDLSKFVTKQQDEKIKSRVIKKLIHENEEDQINEAMQKRFQLEGCVADEELGILYVGMEKLGVWKINGENLNDPKPQLVAEVKKSMYDPNATTFQNGMARLTDDIEGMALYKTDNKKGFLIVSVQGIDEFAIFERQTHKYIDSFKVVEGAVDKVTKTDGLAIVSYNLGPLFPKGILVVHDDENTDQDHTIKKANYKIVSFEDIFKAIPDLNLIVK